MMVARLPTGIGAALAAAILFGASTPFAKLLTGAISPVMLAALLYLSAGLGLLGWSTLQRLVRRDARTREAPLRRQDLPWLAGAVLLGGVFAPILLMTGLRYTDGATASLLLTLEGVFTAVLAWRAFGEHLTRPVAVGMLAITLAGALLAWPNAAGYSDALGPVAIVVACLCWAIDNNLTRKVSAADPVQVAGIKGLSAGTVNLTIALAAGASFPAGVNAFAAATVGLLGYGVSLALFVYALRHVGSARTGAYFSLAPFVGAGVSFALLQEAPNAVFWVALALMAAGVWLHVTERHVHAHTHTALEHTHRHTHDKHHQHAHDFDWDPKRAHTHAHVHAPLVHTHPHYPDIHHHHPH
jgi:drug/metabolite transporter (DMT)-like permease